MKNNRVDEFVRKPKRALFHLAWPVMVGMLVQALYNIVDTAWVGRLGTEAIAALAFSFPLYFVLIALNSGIGVGMGSLISRLFGAKNEKQAENVAMHGLLISLAVALLVMAIGFVSLRPIFLLFGATPSVVPLAIDYMGIILFGVIFMFPSFVMNYIFTAQGDTRTPVKVQIIGLMLNIILDPLFIYTFGYGVKGAAIATVISIFVSLLIMIIYFKKKSVLKLEFCCFRFSWKKIGEIISVGGPASLMMLIFSVYVIFLNRFMAHFGTTYVASFGIASRLESIATMPIMAFTISLMTLVAMFYGAKEYDVLKKTVWYGIRISAMITSAFGLLFFIVPTLFLRIFTSDPELLTISAQYLRLDVFTFPLIAVTMGVSRVLQGLGQGMPGLIINLMRIFLVAVPFAALFVYVLHLGYLWIAVAMICGGLVSSTTGIIWLSHTFKKLHIQG